MFDLKTMRERAGLTQSALAKRLGINQVQISRYESSPENVPIGLIGDYLAALGLDLNTAIARSEANQPQTAKLEINKPYSKLHGRVQRVCDYLSHIQPDDVTHPFIETRQLTEVICNELSAIAKKPRLILAGNFDAGKSHLANYLLGDHYLPTGYQPETRLPVYIHHLKDRPKFIQEEVWVMSSGFNPQRWQDKEHACSHKRVGGNFLTLKDWAALSGKHASEEAGAILAFIDSPLLEGCELIDTCGTLEKADDKQPLLSAPSLHDQDVVIYASPARGFLSGPDILRIQLMLNSKQSRNPANPLDGLFLVATHADPALKEEDLTTIIDQGTLRLQKELAANWPTELNAPDTKALLSHTVSFWSESPARCKDLVIKLNDIIGSQRPQAITHQVSETIKSFKENIDTGYQAQISAYQTLLAKNLNQLEPILLQPPVNQSHWHNEIRQLIDKLHSKSSRFIETTFSESLDLKRLESNIKSEFPNQEEARQYAASRLIIKLQQSVSEELLRLTEILRPEITTYFSRFPTPELDAAENLQAEKVHLPTNTRGLALGSAAGLAGIGPFAAWASTLGPWGSYLVIAKGASALGFSTTGAAAAVTAVSAIGGPAVLAAGLVIVGAVLGGSFMGRSWQSRLARGIVSQLNESGLKEHLISACDNYWQAVYESFNGQSVQIEKELKHLQQTITKLSSAEESPDTLQKQILSAQLEHKQLMSIPW